jgi:hypothetical protein
MHKMKMTKTKAKFRAAKKAKHELDRLNMKRRSRAKHAAMMDRRAEKIASLLEEQST